MSDAVQIWANGRIPPGVGIAIIEDPDPGNSTPSVAHISLTVAQAREVLATLAQAIERASVAGG